MKVHYINILLFALLLNILEHNNRNHKNPTHYTPKVPTTRSLCECELYAPANYDNDPQMKRVMQQFEDRTSQRFHEYDEIMKSKRMQCKEQCDKEIQKIILKDKLEKELMEKFATLHTDIQSDSIPTCICKKSLADKTEKFCLNCGKNMGAIAPWWGLVCGVGYEGWKTAAMAAAEKAGVDAGITAAIDALKRLLGLGSLTKAQWTNLVTAETFKNPTVLSSSLKELSNKICMTVNENFNTEDAICLYKLGGDRKLITAITTHTKTAATNAAAQATTVTEAEISKVTSASTTYYTAIYASVVSIVIIILIMVIIYLILRYLRKKKMKKKLEYIKLLKE
ncbi:rifin [Plasmodium reichenowi]|uniref:Rifin n=1 Tax=Plasmodium reichenowi TaxID=5854 RepID=A0A060RQE3_PLARE|nr:rifin [Plasmodium reichenowi]